jgi:hypothetical protein
MVRAQDNGFCIGRVVKDTRCEHCRQYYGRDRRAVYNLEGDDLCAACADMIVSNVIRQRRTR